MWIPTKERQPENAGDYLAQIKLEYGGHYMQTIHFWDGHWNAYPGSDLENEMTDCVVAWQPLPEPYEEGEER